MYVALLRHPFSYVLFLPVRCYIGERRANERLGLAPTDLNQVEQDETCICNQVAKFTNLLRYG